MTKILKRLELIKTAIAIEDEEIIGLQVDKLKMLNIDDTVRNILSMVENCDYGNVAIAITEYIDKYSGVIVYEDAEIQGLRLELKALEKKLQKLSEEKSDTLNSIHEFNTQYNLKLGEVLKEILSLRKEILRQKALEKEHEYKRTKVEYDEVLNNLEEAAQKKEEIAKKLQDADLDEYDELFEELKKIKEEYDDLKEELKKKKKTYEEMSQEKEEEFQEQAQAEEEFEEFSSNYEEELKEIHPELTDNEEKELKKLYRKASRLCHPDIVEHRVKAEAEEIFISLNDAYVKKDLEQVKEILYALENGTKFNIASDSITDAEILKTKIRELRKKVGEIISEINEIKSEDTYETIQEIKDWDEYFNTLENDLEDEVSRLESVLEEIGQ